MSGIPTDNVWNISDVSDQVLQKIVAKGELEDIVAKERISTRFGSAVDANLAIMKSLDSRELDLSTDNEVKLFRKMPKMKSYFGEEVEELAKYNRNVEGIGGNPDNVIDYVEAAMKLDPGYTASEVRYIDDNSGFLWHFDGLSRLFRVPELNMKICTKGSYVMKYDKDRIYLLAFFYEDDVLTESIPSVQIAVVVVGGPVDFCPSLKLLPNLRELQLVMYGESVTNLLDNLDLSIGNKLEVISIDCSENLGIVEKCIKTLSHIIKARPIKKVEVVMDVSDHAYVQDIIQMILGTGNGFINDVKVVLRIETLTTRLLTCFKIKGSEMICAETPHMFRDFNILISILQRFKNVTRIEINMDESDMKVDEMRHICQQIVAADHRRSIKLNLESSNPVHSIDVEKY